jgi:hypothetical protein
MTVHDDAQLNHAKFTHNSLSLGCSQLACQWVGMGSYHHRLQDMRNFFFSAAHSLR